MSLFKILGIDGMQQKDEEAKPLPGAGEDQTFDDGFKVGFGLGNKVGHLAGHLCQARRDHKTINKLGHRLSHAGRKVGKLKKALRAQITANTLTAAALDD